MAQILTNKKTGKKFPIPSFKRRGSPPNIDNRKNLLTVTEFNKILAERQVRTKDLATDEEIEQGEAKAISLNPEHDDNDIIFLTKESPIDISQKKFESNKTARNEEIERIKESEGVKDNDA